MKKIATLLALLVSLYATAQFTVSDAVPLDKDDKIITSGITKDNHHYVLTGPKSVSTVNGRPVNAKLTLYHFDADLKLVAQKEVKPPKYGKGIFEALSIFQVGEKLLLFGKSEYTMGGVCQLGYTTIDKTALTFGTKMSDIAEFEFSNWHVGGQPIIEFKQNAPGKSVGIMIESARSVQQGNGRSVSQKFTKYLLLDPACLVHTCLDFINRERPTTYANRGFYISSSDEMYMLINEQEYVDLIGEWYKDEKQLRKLAKSEHGARLYKYNPADKSTLKKEVQFADSTLLIEQICFTEADGEVFFGGIASNAVHQQSRALLGDTLNLPVFSRYCFVRKTAFTGMIIVSRSETALIDTAIERKELRYTFQDEERVFTEFDAMEITAITRAENGQWIFSGGCYVQAKYPPMEELKNNPAYTIKRDEEGRITEFSTTEFNDKVYRRYHHLFRLNVDLGKGSVQCATTGVAFTVTVPQRDYNNDNVLAGANFSAGTLYFDDNSGKEIYSWNGSGSANAVNLNLSGPLAIAHTASPSSHCRYLIVTNGSSFTIARPKM